MKIRTFVVTVVAVVSSFGLLAPAAHATACYDVQVVANGDSVVSQSGCI